MIIYQIYPRSFYDTNDDGIGDLQGIAEKIPYIADLGAEAIWISPFYTSPMKDFGYDIADYRGVDPIFGTLDDFDAVVKAAHDHGLKVLIDQVWGHTSDQHPWFQESRKSQQNDKHEWYLWSDPKADGFFPNNWLSIFGGPAWTWNPARRQYYLHQFLPSQPNLNLRNPDVVDAVMDDAWFWIERGVDGFRVDAVPYFLVDPQWRDNPPLQGTEQQDIFQANINPRKWQDNIHTQSLPELYDWLADARHHFQKRGKDVLLLGEVTIGGLKHASQYVHGPSRLQKVYTSDLIKLDITPQNMQKLVADLLHHFDDADKMCWSLGNHDVKRLMSRLPTVDTAQFWRCLVAWYFCLEGSLCWYQGDELGLDEADIPFDLIQDPYGKTFWPDFKGRDGCRTPMPWQGDLPHAGFTGGNRPWLPVPLHHHELAVDRQQDVAGSCYEWVKQWTGLRRQNSALLNGKTFLPDHAPLTGFLRETPQQKVLCLFNLGDQTVDLPEQGKIILFQQGVTQGKIAPYGIYIIEL